MRNSTKIQNVLNSIKLTKNNKKQLINFCVLFISVLTSLVLVEFSSTLLLKTTKIQPKVKFVDSLLAPNSVPSVINDVDTSKVSPHPYMLYHLTKNYVRDGRQEHNSHGYRGEEFSLDKQPNEYRILAIGGSTTYGTGVESFKESWPYLLEKMFHKQGIDNLTVINAGLPSATSAELLASWVFKHKYLNADLLIIHTGGNDIFPLLFDDYHPEYYHYRARGNSYVFPSSIKFLIEQSNTIKLITALSVSSDELINPVYSQRNLIPIMRGEVTLTKNTANNKPIGFYRNIKTLIQVAKQDKVNVLIMPFIGASEQKLNKLSMWKTIVPWYQSELNHHRKILADIAKEEKTSFLNLDNRFFPDDLFVDNCHLNQSGQKKKALLVFQYLLNSEMLTNKPS